MNKLVKGLLKQNKTREKAIFDENKEIYTNMIVYLRGSDLTDYNQESVREDIIELIIDGQQRGDNIKKVMGGRYKEICDEIIDAMPKETKKNKMMEFAGSSLNGLLILGVIALVENLITGLISKETELNFMLTVGDIINGILIILIANAVVWVITKKAFETKLFSFLKTWVIVVVLFSTILLSNIYLTTIVVNISLSLAAIIFLSIFLLVKILWNHSIVIK